MPPQGGEAVSLLRRVHWVASTRLLGIHSLKMPSGNAIHLKALIIHRQKKIFLVVQTCYNKTNQIFRGIF